MSQDSDFFDQRAKDASELASSAILDNVRDRELRSAAAWSAMADRARRVEKSRRAATLAKEEERAQISAVGTADEPPADDPSDDSAAQPDREGAGDGSE